MSQEQPLFQWNRFGQPVEDLIQPSTVSPREKKAAGTPPVLTNTTSCGGGTGTTLEPPLSALPPTERLYFEDTYLLSATSTVLGVRSLPQEDASNGSRLEHAVVLDKTVVHPQGGGQPSDLATLTSEDGATVFQVVHAGTTKDCPNVVEHRGYFVSGSSFSPGSRVDVTVDGDARRLHARLHSAGHLLDAAMRNVGRGNLEPSKGNHNPGGVAFVEYIGVVPAEERDALIGELNAEMARLISGATPVHVTVEPQGAGKVLRTVSMGGCSCPCGGTHVQNVTEIQGINVTRVKKAKKNTKVYYDLVDAA